ncbi:hypothetical protein F1C58_03850 [Glaciihabitans sp. INWT7]|uniref:hypothetical protein n=1 Tax=Glaciihabitans sp. INWT7 TaxID=2596912 RepID=UPI00162850DD|nr:hypothetical protein [Glaciihabitans sp. INWT7]QNE46127.1 hypothetical protein F1C58_03850 [Glaciihabitans sp. INWT7]
MISLHLRRSLFVIGAPVLAILGSLVAIYGSFPRLGYWPDAAGALFASASILAPFVAGASAWDGLRERRHRGAPLLMTAARHWSDVFRPQMIADLLWAVAIFVVVLVAESIRTVLAGGAGAPTPVLWLVALAVVAGFSALGSVLAAVIRHWVAVPIAATLGVVAYALSAVRVDQFFLPGLNPLDGYVSIDYNLPNTAMFLGQALVAIAAPALLVTGITLASRDNRLFATCGAALSVAVLALGLGIVAGQQARYSVQEPMSQAGEITITGGKPLLTVKILPQYKPISQDLLRRWSRLAAITSKSPLAFDHLEQVPDNHGDAAPRFGRLYLNPSSTDPAEDSIQSALTDIDICSTKSDSTQQGISNDIAVNFWLQDVRSQQGTTIGIAQTRDNINYLFNLSPAEGREWFAKHAREYTSCTLSNTDFQ